MVSDFPLSYAFSNLIIPHHYYWRMPIPLTYPGFKCVLEHLDAVKRAHIIGRTPGLQKVDKLIPLCLGNLIIVTDCFYNKLKINKLSIKCEKDEVKLKMNGKRFSCQISESLEDKMKKLINFYICERSKIHVDNLNWNKSLLPDFLPVDSKLRVNSLAANTNQFDTLLPFIDPRSFPLKTMVTFSEPSTYNSYIATSAETLILGSSFNTTITLEELKKLKNKRVVFERVSFSSIDMVSLIEYHIETKKDIRTTFVITAVSTIFINDILREFDEAFGDFRCYLLGVNERFVPGSSRFSIPINNESRIQVYATEDPDKDDRWKIVMKPVSAVYHFKHRY
ncbi:hypothetical protein GCK72_007884 [Caenorhabditis remanei]|uniref:DUF38 domain-containing protein n=1 Tax=Caenorhabditis remanei TaxID=31234 RepID=A0A6A5HMU6_CAERE|nr:hypothetical protein GCK72_007884 [Caenorhabditis remanei]KAF1767924.1 hypothetical protein GCK72_007884 [Caenorhabditis remanei]